MAFENVMYTTKVTVKGGRNGEAASADGRLNLKLASPKEMGGSEHMQGTNPEQLFAAGYGACFLGALGHVAAQRKIAVPKDVSLDAEVSLGRNGETLGIAAKLHVTLPGMDKKQAEELVDAAHHFCPYSHATRNNIEVQLSVSV
jgi:Ohr subfamily peroxiredoxin